MNLTLARQRIGREFGGAEGYVEALARAFCAAGVNVKLLCQKVSDNLRDDGYETVIVPDSQVNMLGIIRFAAEVRMYNESHAGEVVFGFDRLPGVPFIRAGDGCHAAYMTAMKIPGYKKLSPKHATQLRLEKKMVTNPALKCLFPNSMMVGEEYENMYKMPPGRIKVVHTGLPPMPYSAHTKNSARVELKIDSESKVLLFVGNEYKRKGLPVLLKAFSILKKEGNAAGWELLVVGKGDIEKYKSMAKDLDIDFFVRFFGHQPDVDLFYIASDCFVLPTQYDPFARVCLEAARYMMPVITTRHNGFSDFLGDRYVMSDPLAIEELMSSLVDVLQFETFREGLVNKTAGLTIEQNAKDYIQHIEGCLKNNTV